MAGLPGVLSSEPDVRVVGEADIAACYALMRALRPQLSSEAEFIERWRRQSEQGYSIVVIWRAQRPVALAGFRVQENLVHGRFLCWIVSRRKAARAAVASSCSTPRLRIRWGIASIIARACWRCRFASIACSIDDERPGSGSKRRHLAREITLAFEADAGQVGQRDVAVARRDAVRESAVGLEQVRIALVATEAEASRDHQ